MFGILVTSFFLVSWPILVSWSFFLPESFAETPNFPPMTKAQGRFPKFFWPMTGRSQNGPHTSQHPMLRGPQVLALFFAQIWLGVAMKTSLKYGGTYNLRRSMLAAIWELLPLLFHLRITKNMFIQISFNLCPGKHLCSNQSTHQHPLPHTTTAGFFVRWSLVFFKAMLGWVKRPRRQAQMLRRVSALFVNHPNDFFHVNEEKKTTRTVLCFCKGLAAGDWLACLKWTSVPTIPRYHIHPQQREDEEVVQYNKRRESYSLLP